MVAYFQFQKVNIYDVVIKQNLFHNNSLMNHVKDLRKKIVETLQCDFIYMSTI